MTNLERDEYTVKAKSLGLVEVESTVAWYYLPDDQRWHLARTWATERDGSKEVAGVPAAVPECLGKMVGDIDWHGPFPLPTLDHLYATVCEVCWEKHNGT